MLHTLGSGSELSNYLNCFFANFYVNYPNVNKFSANICALIVIVFTKNKGGRGREKYVK